MPPPSGGMPGAPLPGAPVPPVPASLTGAVTSLSLLGVFAFAFFSFAVVRRYAHPRERDAVTSATATAGITLALAVAACVLPADVFLVSATSDAALGVKLPWAQDARTLAQLSNAVGWVYDGAFLGMLLFCFAAVPFVYFLFEEKDEEVPMKKVRAPGPYQFLIIGGANTRLLYSAFPRLAA